MSIKSTSIRLSGPTSFLSAVALLWLASSSTRLQAQTMVTAGINSPTYSLTDENGVNLTSNKPTANLDDVGIGSSSHPLRHTVLTDYGQSQFPQILFIDSFTGTVQPPQSSDTSPVCTGYNSYLDVTLAGSGDRMCGTAGGSYIAFRSTGSTMTTNGDGTLIYTQRDGTQRLYGTTPSNRLLARITSPEGRITTLTYKSAVVGSVTYYRLQSVTRNDGLQLKYTYGSNAPPTSYPLGAWGQIATVTAINNAIDYCDPAADSCSLTQSWPFATQNWTASGSLKYLTVVDAVGRSTRFTTGIPVLSGGVYVNPVNYIDDQLLAIRSPTSTSADDVVFTWCAYSGEYNCMHQGVKKVSAEGFDWNYPASSGSGGVSLYISISATRPDGGGKITQQQRGNSAAGPMISYYDGRSRRTFYFESAVSNRVSSVLLGDGDTLSYQYDGRSNITQETHTPSSGSSLAPAIRLANYDTTCANPLTCNSPNWVKDARGNQTDFRYDPTHGGVISVTSPPDRNGIRPQVRYSYVQRYAWYKNSTGAVVQAATPIWVLSAEKFCRSSAALSDGSGCTNPADEVVTNYDYGPTTGANNLFLRGVTMTADGVTLRTCFGNDIYGNRISETLPKAGLQSCP